MKVLYDAAPSRQIIKDPCPPNSCTCFGEYDPCGELCGAFCLELGCSGNRCSAYTGLLDSAPGGLGWI